MNISQKCQYALRALFELARSYGKGPKSISEISEAQAIPHRFLELIMNELRHGGFAESRRGKNGGYMLAVSPASISVGDIIRFVDGPIAPVKCINNGDKDAQCPLHGNCAFIGLWTQAMEASSAVYDNKTLKGLVEDQEARNKKYVPAYSI